jgi:membrane-bound lytic murein transglycosylase B
MVTTTSRPPRRARAAAVVAAAALTLGAPAAVASESDAVDGSDAWTDAAEEPQRIERQVTLRAVGEGPSRGPSVKEATRLAAVVTAWISENGTDLAAVSATGSNDLPVSADRAYRRAALTMAEESPGCGLPWTLLAAIGRVESDHGRYGGSELGFDGRPQPAIVGIALNGQGPVRAIGDTDDGRWDGDQVWDRAVGPMQFIPGTWATSGRDGDEDGVATPHDLDDAALAAAAYLCRAGDLRDGSTRAAAILSYNNSSAYVALVDAYERGYRTGSFDVPTPFGP